MFTTIKSKIRSKNTSIYFFISLIIVGYGQPHWGWFLGFLASILGYILIFKVILDLSSKTKRFFIGAIWYFCVELIQLTWMTSSEYQGIYVYFFYLFVCSGVGVQFGILSLLFPKEKRITFFRCLFLASCWALFEWSRLFFISGFPFNPSGLALSANDYSMQIASIGGVFFLSWIVIATNLIGLKCLIEKGNIKVMAVYLIFILFPLLFGWVHIKYHETNIIEDNKVLLVQTAVTPYEKQGFRSFEKMIHPQMQWDQILSLLKEHKGEDLSLIVFPENTVPFPAFEPIFYYSKVKRAFIKHFGSEVESFFPKFKEPFIYQFKDENDFAATNAFWAQTIANYFNSQVIIGLDDLIVTSNKDYKTFASAFSFNPNSSTYEKYNKRVLLPFVENLPFEWCRFIANKYGISGWFERGDKPKVFHGEVLVSPSICIEEVYGNLIRESRLLGANVFVNITNDVWFPNSLLPLHHMYLGRLRSIENGVSELRACNTGITTVIDPLGRVKITKEMKKNEWIKGGFIYSFSSYNYQTLYTNLGDGFILGLSLMICLCYIVLMYRKASSL